MNEFDKKIYNQAFECWKRHTDFYTLWRDNVISAENELDGNFSDQTVENLMNCITKKLGYKDLSDKYAKICHEFKEKYDL